MAIKVDFEGWVNEVKTFDWGTVLRVTHDQRAKNDSTGQWETVSKDYIDVSVTADLLAGLHDSKVVRVIGNLKVSTYPKKDGSTGVSLKVRASELIPVQRGQKSEAPASSPASADGWNTPF